MKPMLLLAGILALLAAPAPARAQQDELPLSLPRTYSDEDCQDLNAQLDDTLEINPVEDALAAEIRKERLRADDACNSGRYADGARLLRGILDRLIAARTGQ
jgi:hypothetical protein